MDSVFFVFDYRHVLGRRPKLTHNWRRLDFSLLSGLNRLRIVSRPAELCKIKFHNVLEQVFHLVLALKLGWVDDSFVLEVSEEVSEILHNLFSFVTRCLRFICQVLI